jgi:hypothetical protein
MTPIRIQRMRTKGWRMPPNTVCVCRPGKYGNPIKVGMFKGFTAQNARDNYERWVKRDPVFYSYDNAFGPPPTFEAIVRDLRGKNLACWCPLDQPCHADVLLDLANGPICEAAP